MGAVDGTTVQRVTVGEKTIMVELAGVDSDVDSERDGTTAGLAHRPPGDAVSTDGRGIETLVDWATDGPEDAGSPLRTAIGLAAINALSAPHIDWQTGDPMALLDRSVGTIATVGLFKPALRKFSNVDVRVIERTEMDVDDIPTPEGVRLTGFRPAEAEAAMAAADVVFITGSTLVYGGLEQYLDAVPAGATTVLIGATASLLPAAAFAAGVDIVAGAVVTDRQRVRAAVRAAACGTELHTAGVEKVFVAADPSQDGSHGIADSIDRIGQPLRD